MTGLSTAAQPARTVGGVRKDHPLYELWLHMRSRCYKPEDSDFPNYGGRGIEVCRRWRDAADGFERFVADMGPRLCGSVLGRIDIDGDYERANCRWATRTEQNRNSRHCKLTLDHAQEILGRLEHGEGPTSIARRFGVTDTLVYLIRARKTWRDLEPMQRAA